jgi:hypothetical protein
VRQGGDTPALKCAILDRDVVLEAYPGAFLLADHYRSYPMILMKLGRVRDGGARELLEQAWRRAAPKRLLAARS